MLSMASLSLRRLRPVWPLASALPFSTGACRCRRMSPAAKAQRNMRKLGPMRHEAARKQVGADGPGPGASLSDWFSEAEFEAEVEAEVEVEAEAEAEPDVSSRDSQKEKPDPSRPGPSPSEPRVDSVLQESKHASSTPRPYRLVKQGQKHAQVVFEEQPPDPSPSPTPPRPSLTEDAPSTPSTRPSGTEEADESSETAQDPKEGDNGEMSETAQDQNARAAGTEDNDKTPETAQDQKGGTENTPETVPPAPKSKRAENKVKYTKEERRAYAEKKLQEKLAWAQAVLERRGQKGESRQTGGSRIMAESRQTRGSNGVSAEQKPKRTPLDDTVVVMVTGASPSLLESDFFRLGRKGQLMDGWVSGLFKVVQAREPVTHEPLGQYFLFFDSHAAALQYQDDVRQLHQLNWSTLADAWKGPGAPPGTEPTRPIPHVDQEAAKAKAAFTLVPPTVAPMLHLQSVEMLWRELSKHSDRLTQHVLSSTGPNKTSGPHSNGPAESAAAAAAAADAAMADGLDDAVTGGPYGYVLDHLNGEPRTGENQRVLLSLGNDKMSDTKLREAIEADGARRNLAWRLEPGDQGVQPLQLTGKKSRVRQGQPDWHLTRVYGRFVLTFADAIEARRFARCWHKTQLVDPRTERVVTLDVTPLW